MKSNRMAKKFLIFYILGLTLMLISLVAFTGLTSGISSVLADDGGAAAADGGGDAGAGDAGGDAGGDASAGGDAAGGGDAGGSDAGGDDAGGDEGGDASAGDDAAGGDEGGDASAGDDAAGGDEGGDASAGDDAAGGDEGGDASAGDDAAGGDEGGDDASAGDDTSPGDDAAAGEDATGEDAAGEDAGGDDAAGEDAGGDEAGAEDAAGEDDAGDDAAGEVAGDEDADEGQSDGLASPVVSTDQSDYTADQSPVINLSYLAPNTDVSVTVTDPNGSVTDMIATTDENGNATLNYAPEGGLLQGEYNIVATDGTTTVTAVFSDDYGCGTDYYFYQWANDKGTPGIEDWITTNLDETNSEYCEGEVVPFMLKIEDFGSGSKNVTIYYDYSRYNAYEDDQVGAYDYLDNYNETESPASPTGSWAGWVTNGMFTYYNTTLSYTGPTTPSGSPSDVESSMTITLNADQNWNNVYVVWGGHLATEADWGEGKGASSITGGPLEMDTSVTSSRYMELGTICGWEEIRLYKSGPEFAHVGDTITYTYVIFNAGENDYYEGDIQIYDSIVGTIPGWYPGQDYLDPGDIWTYTRNYTILSTDTDPLHNDAEVQIEECVGGHYEDVWVCGWYWQCGHKYYGWHWESDWVDDYAFVTRDSDFWDVDILHPNIVVDKIADACCAHEGDTIHYTVYVTIPVEGMDTPLHNIELTDNFLGIPIPASMLPDNGDDGNGILEYGETWEYYFDYIVMPGDDMFTNTAEVTGYDESWGTDHETGGSCGGKDYDGFATDEDTTSPIDVLHPGIAVDKTGPDTSIEGQAIQYTFVVTNTSVDTPLNGVSIIDSLAPAVVYIGGDTNLDGWLDPGESWTFTADYNIPVGTVGEMVNTATVSGMDACEGEATGEDSWIVDVAALERGAVPGPEGFFLSVDILGNIANYPVTPDGALLIDVTQTSPDGNLTLYIPMGTIVRNADGSAAYLNPDPDVFGIQAGTVASAGDAAVIGAYDLTPTGIWFDNGQATLTAKYDAGAVPEGKNLTWAYYDVSSGQWVDVETSGAVAAGGEPQAACNASSLQLFALLAK